MREPLYFRGIIWVNTLFLNHNDTRVILPKVLAWYIDSYSIKNKNIFKFSYPSGIDKENDILIIDT